MTCVVNGTFLKKSERPSGVLPPAQRRAVPLGATLQLQAAPAGPVDDYWRVTLAELHASPLYLMIGDSISLGYEATAKALLAPHGWTVVHSEGNAGNANNIIHNLDCYLQQAGGRPAVVTFNAGIHDLARGQEWLSLVSRWLGRGIQIYLYIFLFFFLL